MLVLAGIFGVLMLVITNAVAAVSKRPGWIAAWSIAIAIAPAGLGVVSPTLIECGVALAFLIGILISSRRVRSFHFLSVTTVVIIFGLNSWFAWHSVSGFKEQFPLESIENRVRPLPPGKSQTLSANSAALSDLEDQINADYHRGSFLSRDASLRKLHEETFQVFINRPNFGVMRMFGFDEERAKRGLRYNLGPDQPGLRSPSPWFSDSPDAKNAETFKFDGKELHFTSVLDFLHPAGWGYFKDLRHVAGFQPHMFSEVPKSPERWKVESIELVGLVTHDSPVVYISEHLPRMDELRTAPYRAPDNSKCSA